MTPPASTRTDIGSPERLLQPLTLARSTTDLPSILRASRGGFVCKYRNPPRESAEED